MQKTRMRLTTLIVVAAMFVAVIAAASPAFGQMSEETVVYRFYNQGTGTHFYTASMEERDYVIATWPSVFSYEGPAFAILPVGYMPPEYEPPRGPVYRFYNKLTKSHFYTISGTEADTVKAKYPAVYNYDGIAFEAYTAGSEFSPVMPVYRFYNMKNGAHFFTISPTEKAVVQIQYRDTYKFEGVAFWAVPYGYYVF